MRDERKYRDDLERRFLDDALRTRTRGFRLLVVAALMWLYLLARLLLPPGVLLGSGGEHGAGCDGPLLFEEIRSGYDDGIANVCVLEPWPMIFAVLALSLPVGLAGAILYVRGVLSANLGHYIRTMTGQ
ncbi:hypothetical protein [Streptomyces sp. NPDC056983]|uniref:hypothetical protein n=1 Tax=Streptomyces sp. NPDC056983 TaxID=3345987 RepID=UPI00363DA997